MKSRTLSATALILLIRPLVIHVDRVLLYDAADGKLLREFAAVTTPINLNVIEITEIHFPGRER